MLNDRVHSSIRSDYNYFNKNIIVLFSSQQPDFDKPVFTVRPLLLKIKKQHTNIYRLKISESFKTILKSFYKTDILLFLLFRKLHMRLKTISFIFRKIQEPVKSKLNSLFLVFIMFLCLFFYNTSSSKLVGMVKNRKVM